MRHLIVRTLCIVSCILSPAISISEEWITLQPGTGSTTYDLFSKSSEYGGELTMDWTGLKAAAGTEIGGVFAGTLCPDDIAGYIDDQVLHCGKLGSSIATYQFPPVSDAVLPKGMIELGVLADAMAAPRFQGESEIAAFPSQLSLTYTDPALKEFGLDQITSTFRYVSLPDEGSIFDQPTFAPEGFEGLNDGEEVAVVCDYEWNGSKWVLVCRVVGPGGAPEGFEVDFGALEIEALGAPIPKFSLRPYTFGE